MPRRSNAESRCSRGELRGAGLAMARSPLLGQHG